MRLTLIIDGVPHQIDSADPDLLARWIVEIFGRIRAIYPSTIIEFQVAPSFVPDGLGGWRPDWTADSRVLGRVEPAATPRELLAALGRQLDELEALEHG